MHDVAAVARTVARRTLGAAGDLRGRIRHPNRSPRSPVVLMYHAVTASLDRTWGPWQYAVETATFEDHLQRLDRTRTLVELGDLVRWLRGEGSIPDDAAVLTFDDGYRNFRTEVLPVLERYDAPATVYASTALAGEDATAPYEQRLSRAILARDSLSVDTGWVSLETAVDSTADAVEAYRRLRDATKRRSPERRTELLDAIGVPSAPTASMLSASDLRELESHPLVTVGSHGHHHVPLAATPGHDVAENVRTSRDRLGEILGSAPEHFSYPYGSHDRSVVRAVADAGFESAVTTRSRPVAPRDWDRPYAIPRVDGSSWFPG